MHVFLLRISGKISAFFSSVFLLLTSDELFQGKEDENTSHRMPQDNWWWPEMQGSSYKFRIWYSMQGDLILHMAMFFFTPFLFSHNHLGDLSVYLLWIQIYSEMIGNVMVDARSTGKYYHCKCGISHSCLYLYSFCYFSFFTQGSLILYPCSYFSFFTEGLIDFIPEVYVQLQ